MSYPSSYWLNVTNIVLGLIVLICFAAVAFGVIQELAAWRKKKGATSKLDREIVDLVSSYGDHAFNDPRLGVTMADGGEKLGKKDEA